MLPEILCNQRELALLGQIGAVALSALAYRRLRRHTQYEAPGLHPPSQLDPIAFAWARCNPGALFPQALKGTPSALAMMLASAPQPRSSVGVKKAA